MYYIIILWNLLLKDLPIVDTYRAPNNYIYGYISSVELLLNEHDNIGTGMCIRLASSKAVLTGYHYLDLLGLADDLQFNPNRLLYVR